MRTPTGTGWLRSFAIGSLLVAALVSGCSGDPEKPGTLPSESPTPTSSSPSPTPTPVEEQVEAAVRAYFDELTRAAQTLDTAKLKKLSLRSCPCTGSANAIDQVRRMNHRTPGATWQVRRVDVHDVIKQTASADVTYRVPSYPLLAKSGRVLDQFPTRRKHVDLTLLQIDGRWLISNVFDLES